MKHETFQKKQPDWTIVGDWVVDENWFLTRFDSDLSKHTGRMRYRNLESVDTHNPAPANSHTPAPPVDIRDFDSQERYLDLCAAGNLVQALHTSLDDGTGNAPYLGVVALGEWAKGDEKLLQHLVHSGAGTTGCTAGRLRYQLTPGRFCPNPPPGLRLINIGAGALTQRIVRLWGKEGNEWTIQSRVDFSPTGSKKHPARIPADVRLDATKGVLIADLGRGAVNESLIDLLLKKVRGAKFFVRVKKPEIEWLQLLKHTNQLELVVLGPEVSPMQSPFEHWHRDGAVTKQFLDLVDNHPMLAEAKNVVILTENRAIIGKFEGKDGPVTVVGQSQASTHAINQVGWADAVVMALALELQKPRPKNDSKAFEHRVTSALDLADRCHGVSGIPDWTPTKPAPPDVKLQRDWKSQGKAWEEATTGLGIVKEYDSPSFDVWRGYSQLENYVSLIHEKSKVLDEIGKSLRDFKRGRLDRSVGLMVEADPGSGKTFLAQCLAAHFGYSMISVDVAQLVTRDDLFDYFDRIGTHQAESDTPVLAFVDEINARIGSQTAYGAFLAPLESNVYSRRGLAHTLKPCVWIFTGTKVKDGDSDEKRSDLRSRLAAWHSIDFESLRSRAEKSDRDIGRARVDASARLEQVYFGAGMINRAHPDVRSVRLEVLRYFYSMDPLRAPFRSIRRSVSPMRDMEGGEVTMANLNAFEQLTMINPVENDLDDHTPIRLNFKPTASG